MKSRVLALTLALAGGAIACTQLALAVADNDSNDDNRQTVMGELNEGADIVYAKIHQTKHYEQEPDDPEYDPEDPIHAYSIGSRTCNHGNEPLAWVLNGTPGFASNLYRLDDGRLMQVGMAWVKHACCVINLNNPGICGFECSAGPPATLRPGCMDVYSAFFNGIQDRLGPRTEINPFTGEFASLSIGLYTTIERRLQVRQSDLDPAQFSDALYFVEGVYVCTDTAAAGNWHNNATYRRVSIDADTFDLVLEPEQFPTVPAIFAWKDHGKGVNQPDDEVTIVTVDHPEEGRFFAAHKVSDNDDGTWRYEYSVYNLFSDLAAGALRIEIGEGVNITNVGFHAPTYHSGENQDNSPWEHEITADAVMWSVTDTAASDLKANAIRWGTMYNFWFDADQPPAEFSGVIQMHQPNDISELSFPAIGPRSSCPADLNDDAQINAADLLLLLEHWGHCPGCPADLNDDGMVNVLDLLILLEAWGSCP